MTTEMAKQLRKERKQELQAEARERRRELTNPRILRPKKLDVDEMFRLGGKLLVDMVEGRITPRELKAEIKRITERRGALPFFLDQRRRVRKAKP